MASSDHHLVGCHYLPLTRSMYFSSYANWVDVYQALHLRQRRRLTQPGAVPIVQVRFVHLHRMVKGCVHLVAEHSAMYGIDRAQESSVVHKAAQGLAPSNLRIPRPFGYNTTRSWRNLQGVLPAQFHPYWDRPDWRKITGDSYPRESDPTYCCRWKMAGYNLQNHFAHIAAVAPILCYSLGA